MGNCQVKSELVQLRRLVIIANIYGLEDVPSGVLAIVQEGIPPSTG